MRALPPPSPAVGVGGAGPRPLVTRRDRRSHVSRTRILFAALSCLAEDGYARASTLAIQRRADVSRGRLLHHFPSKHGLLVAAAQKIASERVAEAVTAVGVTSPDGTSERIDEAVTAMWRRFQEDLYFKASTELWIAAAHDAELLAVLEPAERRLNAAIRGAVSAMFGPTHAAHADFGACCDVLLTSMRGLAVADAFSGAEHRHRRHLQAWIRMARAMLDEPG